MERNSIFTQNAERLQYICYLITQQRAHTSITTFCVPQPFCPSSPTSSSWFRESKEKLKTVFTLTWLLLQSWNIECDLGSRGSWFIYCLKKSKLYWRSQPEPASCHHNWLICHTTVFSGRFCDWINWSTAK